MISTDLAEANCQGTKFNEAAGLGMRFLQKWNLPVPEIASTKEKKTKEKDTTKEQEAPKEKTPKETKDKEDKKKKEKVWMEYQ